MAELDLVNISKKFGSISVIEDLSLAVEKGLFFTLLGPSGCGKTTTLRIIAGLLKPDSGELHIDGKDVTQTPPYRRNIGMVFQNYALFPHMTVQDNIDFGMKVRHFPVEERARLISEILQLTNLSGMETRFPKELSGGQQQRVALARALVFKPNVLLLDEPLSNLDLKVRVYMRREIKRLTRQVNSTTINVTHDQGEALSMSDVIGVMEKGRLVQVGTPKEIYERPANRFVADFIGEANFLTAKITGREGEQIVAEAGGMAVYATPLDGRTLVPGSEVTLSVRPERVAISKAAGTGKNVYHGRIEELEYYGSFIRVSVSVGEMLLNSTAPNEYLPSLGRGDKVYVSFNPEDCFLSAA